MIDTIVIGLAVVYFGGILLLAVSAARTRYPRDPHYRPSVTIIVAARNEEHILGRCLDSLAALSYPKELLDIVIVDDHSTDDTAAVVRRYAEQFSHIRLMAAGPPVGHLQGKVNAITQAMDVARGEIVLLTDADCEVPIRWVEDTVKYYTEGRIGLVAGFTYLSHSSSFEAMQTLDWLGLVTLAAGAIPLGVPLTAVGTNFSVRRSAYDRVGGYRSIPFSITEDYALFRAVTAAGYEARLPLDQGMLVKSEPCRTWSTLYRQRLRWLSGGRGMHWQAIAGFIPAWLFHIALLLALATGSFSALGIGLGLKLAADVVLLIPTVSRFRCWALLRFFWAFEVYFFAYVLVFPPLVSFTREIRWKERTLAG